MGTRRNGIVETTKGQNSAINVGGVMVLILCTSSDGGLYVSQYMSSGFIYPYQMGESIFN